MNDKSEPIIEITGLGNYLGHRWVHKDLDLSVQKGEIIAIIGASGCGKTTLLRAILMLRKQSAGSIKVFGKDLAKCNRDEIEDIRSRWGVMFQSGALFSSLTVLENVMLPMVLKTKLSAEAREKIARLKIAISGLDSVVAGQYPSELSGGMKKRAALARAIALDPELVFLDEPTSGLDPESAGALDELVLHMRDNLGLTFVMVTHDLDTLWHVPDRVVFLGEGKVLAAEPMPEIIKNQHPLIKEYFSGARAKAREKLGEGA